MNETPEQSVLKRFNEHLSRGEMPGIGVVSKLSDGMPGESHIEEELSISEAGQARARSAATGGPPQDTSSQLNNAEVRSLFQVIGKGLDSLVPRSHASFIQDSVVGSITIEVDGEQATYFYLIDEEERKAQGYPISQEIADALRRLDKIAGEVRQADTE